MGREEDQREPRAASDEPLIGESETWEIWERGLVLGSIAVGAMGLFAIGWAVNRFILL